MGIKYVCDMCGAEHPGEYQYGPPFGWALISFQMKPKLNAKPPRATGLGATGGYYPAGEQENSLLVCSQACAEKALDVVKEDLRQKFAD